MFKTILSFILIFGSVSSITSGYISSEEIYSLERRTLEEIHNTIDSIQSVENFLQDLAWKESRNTWDTISRYKYVGKYQFGYAARQTVGAPTFTWREFADNPLIWPESEQDRAVIKLMEVNHRYLLKYFKNPGDNLVNDHLLDTLLAKDAKWFSDGESVVITWSGLYAAAHLTGKGNVRKFLNTQGRYNYADGNGVTTFDYLKTFQNVESKPIL